jgi:hypothetical protein
VLPIPPLSRSLSGVVEESPPPPRLPGGRLISGDLQWQRHRPLEEVYKLNIARPEIDAPGQLDSILPIRSVCMITDVKLMNLIAPVDWSADFAILFVIPMF